MADKDGATRVGRRWRAGRGWSAAAAAWTVALWGASAAGQPPAVTRDVFDHFAGGVGQIEVSAVDTAAKSVIGTGFFVSPAGHVITNYHVISQLVQEPGRHRAEIIDQAGTAFPLSVLAVDVVSDLAVMRSGVPSPHYFVPAPVEVKHGDRLYSLGYPHDLGITIVEGTYNGLLENTLYEKIHFTGSINPGMSGGPTLTADGRVVGVNVATSGDQVSFLVPVRRVAELLTITFDPGFEPPAEFIGSVRDQLFDHQQHTISEILRGPTETVTLGSYELPGRLAPFFDCWGDVTRSEDLPYEVIDHECTTDDVVYLSNEHSSGGINIQHRFLSSDELDRFRFYSLFSANFAEGYGWLGGTRKDVTEFRCEAGFVDVESLTLKTVFCARAYRKLRGLYDAVLKVAVLGSPNRGVESTLVLSGVSFENAQALSRRYLKAIAWQM